MTTRRTLLCGISLVCAVGLSGCAEPPPHQAASPTADTGATPAQNQKYANAIATELRALPGVTAATVTYVPSDLSSSAGVRAFIRSSTAGSETHLMDEFTRRLWTSRINPLSRLSVDVVAAGGGQNGRDITVDEIAPAMTAKYGPRPVPYLPR